MRLHIAQTTSAEWICRKKEGTEKDKRMRRMQQGNEWRQLKERGRTAGTSVPFLTSPAKVLTEAVTKHD